MGTPICVNDVNEIFFNDCKMPRPFNYKPIYITQACNTIFFSSKSNNASLHRRPLEGDNGRAPNDARLHHPHPNNRRRGHRHRHRNQLRRNRSC